MAEVYRAHDIINDSFTVTKVNHQARTYNIYTVRDKRAPGALFQLTEFKLSRIPRKKGPFKEEEFKAAVDMLKALSHPLLPAVLDGFFYGDNAYIVLSHCEGITLEGYISMNVSALAVDEAVKRIVAITGALRYLYERPEPLPFVMIDPALICISEQGDMVLSGFGLQIFLDHYLSSTDPDIWCAPEIAEGHGFTVQSAIYSLGALLYYCVTKHRWNASGRDNAKPRELNPDIPDSLQEALLVSLNKRVEQRYLDIDTLLRKLGNVSNPPVAAVEKAPVDPGERLFIKESTVLKTTVKKAALYASAGAALLLVLLILFFSLRNRVRPGESQSAYVLCGGKRVVSRIDVKSGKCVRTINLSGVARSIALSPDGNGLYVPQGEKSINVFDAEQGTLTGTYPINGSPCGLLFHPSRPLAFIFNDADPFITVWNLQTYQISDEIPVSGPQQQWYLSNGIDVMVTLDAQQNAVDMIDSKTRSPIASFNAGAEPCDCTIDSSGRYVVVPSLSGPLNLFGVSSRSLIKSVEMDKGRKHVYPSRGDVPPCIYVACERENMIYIVDMTTFKITRKARAKGTPVAVRLSPDGRTAYVLNASPNCITVHDGQTLGSLREIMPGLSDPDSFEVWP